MYFIRQFLLITVPVLLLLFLLLEGLLRGAGYIPYYLNASAIVASQNQAILYTLRHDFEGLYAGKRISINSQGFRGAALAKVESSVFRVAIIGDSIAFGQGVDEDETLPMQLRVLLRRKLNSQAEVINLGVPGYDTCQESLRFEESLEKFRPHVAILVYFENDTEPSLVTVRDGVVISSDVRTGLVGDFMAAMRKHSYAYNLVWSHWQVIKHRPSGIDEYSRVLAQRFSANYSGWRKSKACLADLISLARKQSIRFIVIPFPPMAGLSENPYPFESYITAVCDEANAATVECLNVVPALQDPRLRLTVSHIEKHPSAEVLGKVAAQIEKVLP